MAVDRWSEWVFLAEKRHDVFRDSGAPITYQRSDETINGEIQHYAEAPRWASYFMRLLVPTPDNYDGVVVEKFCRPLFKRLRENPEDLQALRALCHLLSDGPSQYAQYRNAQMTEVQVITTLKHYACTGEISPVWSSLDVDADDNNS